MGRLMVLFQSKVALAIIGTLLLGSGAALIAAGPFSATANQTTTRQSPNYTIGSANGTATATPAPSATNNPPGVTPTSGKTPTATPKPRPPTATPTTGSGQVTTLNGTVTSVNTAANQFTVRSGGVTKTVTVTSQTTFTGACTSLSGMNTGWQVRAQGTYQADGSFAASSVNSYFDN
jgi:Domain of unknown function (DUF5666)